LSVTESGRTCQRWDSNTPHGVSGNYYKALVGGNYPEGSRAAAQNHCRNPDGEPRPWCYTTDPEKRFELCDIKQCPAPTTVAPTTAAPVPETVGLKYKERCNSRSPPCSEANTECRAYRCFCKGGYERSGDECVPQDTLPLGHRCSAQGARCADDNSQCRAYRCFCKAGFAKSGSQCV